MDSWIPITVSINVLAKCQYCNRWYPIDGDTLFFQCWDCCQTDEHHGDTQKSPALVVSDEDGIGKAVSNLISAYEQALSDAHNAYIHDSWVKP